MFGVGEEARPARLLKHDDAAWAQVLRQGAQSGDGIGQKHQYETADDGVQVAVYPQVRVLFVSGFAGGAIGERSGVKAIESRSMPKTLPLRPTRAAASRATSPTPDPTSSALADRNPSIAKQPLRIGRQCVGLSADCWCSASLLPST